MKLLLLVFLLSFNSFAEGEACRTATVAYEGAVEVYGANSTVASLGWQAYNICKQELNVDDLVLLEILENRCLANNSEEGSMYRAFEAGCSLRAVEYFLYSQAE